jgi:hypothetical protein
MKLVRVMALGLAVLAGCGGEDSSSPPPPTTGSIRLTNSTSFTIHEAYVAPAAASDWGPQQNTSPIASSASWTLTDIAPGVWDLMAVSIGSFSDYFAYGVDQVVTAGQTLALTAYTSNFSGSLDVTNGYSYPVTAIYVSPANASTWGSNHLSGSLAYGYTYQVYDIPPGVYDVMCVHSNGASSTGSHFIASFSVTDLTCY